MERVYVLETSDGQQFDNRFYESPYTAHAAAARLSQHEVFVKCVVASSEDYPCDHVMIKEFERQFISYMVETCDQHMLLLSEFEPTKFKVFSVSGRAAPVLIGKVQLLFVPDIEQDSVAVGRHLSGERIGRVLSSSNNEQSLLEVIRRFKEFSGSANIG